MRSDCSGWPFDRSREERRRRLAEDAIDHAVVSPAQRARSTWDLVSAELEPVPPATVDDNAYTNVLVSWLLQRVLEVRRGFKGHQAEVQLWERLGVTDKEADHWDDVSRHLNVPFHDGIISQFALVGHGDRHEGAAGKSHPPPFDHVHAQARRRRLRRADGRWAAVRR